MTRKCTCRVTKISRRRRRSRKPGRRWERPKVSLGVPDGALTENGGLVVVSALERRLGMTAVLDGHIGPVKERDRGWTGGEFMSSLATLHLLGHDNLVGFDRMRADEVGDGISPVPAPAATTAATLAARLGQAEREGIEAASAQLTATVLDQLPAPLAALWRQGPVTIDIDARDIEVYSSRKEQVARSYKGGLTGRVHAAIWSQPQLALAADLLAGDEDPRASTIGLFHRALAAVRAAGATGKVTVQGDTGYFAGPIAHAIADADCYFRLGVTRNKAVWRHLAAIDEDDWSECTDMPGAQVAKSTYVPADWPEGTTVLVRRVAHATADISADTRSRRRRTVGAHQLTLALEEGSDTVYAYSFIATNQPLDLDEDFAACENAYRLRTRVEEVFRDTAYGAGLNHLPSASHNVNAAWMWGALLALNLSGWLQLLHPLRPDGSRARIATLRQQLINRAARLVRKGRQHLLRFAPAAHQRIGAVLDRLRPPRPAT
jgi:hypothetical protein